MRQAPADRALCELLAKEIGRALTEAESKIWHGHPVCFLDGNLIVGFSKLNDSVRLLFWSGQSFNEDGLKPAGKCKATEARFTDMQQVDNGALKRWLGKARDIQWDCRSNVKWNGCQNRLK